MPTSNDADANGETGADANGDADADTIRLAHIGNLTGSGGGGIQAARLLEAWTEYGRLEPWGVQATNLNSPENFVTRERAYPIMYPSTVADGLREIDPDVVLVHGFSPDMNDQLRQCAGRERADDADADAGADEDGDADADADADGGGDAGEGGIGGGGEDALDAKWVLRNGMNLYEHWAMSLRHENHRKLTHQVTELDWYDLVVCPTRAAAERQQLFYGPRCPDLCYIPNGIRRDEYVPSSFMLDDELLIVTVSRCGPNDFLLSPLLAVAKILSDETVPVRMEVFGAAHPTLSTAMHEIAGAYDDIVIRGFADQAIVRSRMEQADVVCVPSISHQAVPQAAVEGMAAGNVVLCGDFYETHEEQALVRVPVAHPPAWYKAITDVYEDPDDAREWIRRGIERAADYDIERVVETGYLPAFEALVGDSDGVPETVSVDGETAGAPADRNPAPE